MCIKSEKRFDFLKELVTSVPDLQGDHDDPLSASAAVGLDLTMSTLSAAAANDQTKINTSSMASSASTRPAKLPRQLSTPRPRYGFSNIDNRLTKHDFFFAGEDLEQYH